MPILSVDMVSEEVEQRLAVVVAGIVKMIAVKTNA